MRRISARSSSTGRSSAPKMPSPPAFETAATSAAFVKLAMPACAIGTAMPRTSQTRVRSVVIASLLGTHLRAALRPAHLGFELRTDPKEHVLAAEGGDQLHPDRQTVGVPVQGQRHR